MNLIRAFLMLNRNMIILVIPVMLDVAALAAGLSRVSFYGDPAPPFKIIFETGLPSLSHILEHPVLINTMKFAVYHQGPTLLTWLLIFVFIIVQSFFQGGFIHLLYVIAKGESPAAYTFLSYCTRFGTRFFFLYFILLFFQMSVVTLLALFLQYIGMFAALAIFILLRILLIYFEFTLVIHHASFGEALKISCQYFKHRIKETYIALLSFFLVGGILGYALHMFWSLKAVIAFIFIYAYIMTGIQLALMMSLVKIRELD
ncbi:hypothetical protein AB6A23_04635 [Paenibacillus tarimensis]